MIEEFRHQVPNLTDNQTETECDDLCIEYKVSYWIEGVIIPIIAIFGILGKGRLQKKKTANLMKLVLKVGGGSI